MPPRSPTRDGRFLFDSVAPGVYRVDVQKSGWPRSHARRSPTAECERGTDHRDRVHLQKARVIAGRLLDVSGEPVTDARIMRAGTSGPLGAPSMRLCRRRAAASRPTDLGNSPRPGTRRILRRGHAARRLAFGWCRVGPMANGTAATRVLPARPILAARTDQPSPPARPSITSSSACSRYRRLHLRPRRREKRRCGGRRDGDVDGDPRSKRVLGPTGNARTGDDGRFTDR